MTRRANDPQALGFLKEKLDELSQLGLRRRTPEPERGVSFCSNDYLGLASRAARLSFDDEQASELSSSFDDEQAPELTSAHRRSARAGAASAHSSGEPHPSSTSDTRHSEPRFDHVADLRDRSRDASTGGRQREGSRRDRSTYVAVGSGAARLIAGEHVEHAALERAFAEWLQVPACLAFTSGYAANVGAISALVGPDDLVVSDALNHASIIDGIRLSRARVVVTPHNDLTAVEAALKTRPPKQRAWVLVESYFSMDADGPDLLRLRAVCDRYGAALYVDEAHALGVLGPDGRGRCAEAGIEADVVVGTLGKAFGSQGAFVAGSSDLREWLWNRARSFVFSTGLSPSSAAAARLALEHSIRHPESRETVLAASSLLRRGLTAMAHRANIEVLGFGHVVPIVIGASHQALKVEASLANQGFRIPAIRPPTVPEGTARLRITLNANHTTADIDHLLTALARSLSR